MVDITVAAILACKDINARCGFPKEYGTWGADNIPWPIPHPGDQSSDEVSALSFLLLQEASNGHIAE